MRHLFIPVVLFVGGVIGLLVCLFAFIDGDDHPMAAAISLLCAVIGYREIRFELEPEFGETE